jgi:hypothetical protein
MAARAAPGSRSAAKLMRAATRPDRDLIIALSEFGRHATFIKKQMPMLVMDDMVNALMFAEGRPVRAAQILKKLNRQRSRPIDLRLYPVKKAKDNE